MDEPVDKNSVCAVYDKTRIVGPEKNSKPSADSLLQARLSLLLKDRKKEQHVLKVSVMPRSRGVVLPGAR